MAEPGRKIEALPRDAATREAEAAAAPPGWLERLRSLDAHGRRELWRHVPDEAWPRRALRATAQLVALTIHGFQADQLLLRASALTYVAALSIVPVLGVVISILGAIGGDETLIDFLIDQLTTVTPEVRDTIVGFVTGLDFSRLGTIGGAVLFGTAIFALRHLETTLNEIWGVQGARSFARRFSNYLAVLVVAPLSTGVAVSLATTLQSATVVGWLLEDPTMAWLYGLGLKQVPVFVLFVGFTFLYWFFPNTEVRLRAAALGGLVAAVLFASARTIYVDFQVGAATYQAVFGALSAVPLILAWLYVCWAVLLLGAEVAFAAQNLSYARREMRYGDADVVEQEAVALEIAVSVARCFATGREPPNAEDLADRLDEPIRLVRRLLEALLASEVVRPVQLEEEEDPAYVPAAPLATLTVGRVLRAVRGDPEAAGRHEGPRTPGVAGLLRKLDGAWRGIADETSLEAVLESEATGSS